MATTNFVDGQTVISADWLNDVDNAVYNPGAIPATSIANNPAGGIAATNVQSAINELDSEKQPINVNLTAESSLGAAADKLAYYTGVGAKALTNFFAWGRSFLAAGDITTARSVLDAQETLSSGVNIKTVGGTSLLGSGDVPISALGQTWSNVSRASGTSFQNTTNTVQVFSMSVSGISSLTIEVSPDNSTFYKVFQASNVFGNAAVVGGIAVIPPGHYCRPTYTGTIVFQTELS